MLGRRHPAAEFPLPLLASLAAPSPCSLRSQPPCPLSRCPPKIQYPAKPKHSNSRILQQKSVAGSLADSPLPHYHTLDREHGVSFAPFLFARSLHALYLAAHRKFNTLRNPSTRIAEYCSRSRSRAVLQTARSLITIRSIESMESPSLRFSSLGASMPSISLPTENSIPCETQALE